MLPFIFSVTRDDPGFGLKAGQLVILDLTNAEIPIAGIRPLGRNYGRVLNLVELGILVDVNQDQDLTLLKQAAGGELPPPPGGRKRSPFPRHRRLGLVR
jgi:hypothetical protein